MQVPAPGCRHCGRRMTIYPTRSGDQVISGCPRCDLAPLPPKPARVTRPEGAPNGQDAE